MSDHGPGAAGCGGRARPERRRGSALGAAVAAVAVLTVSACAGSASVAAPAGTVSPAVSPATVSPGTAGASSAVSPSPSSAPHQTESNPPGDIPDQQVFVAYGLPGGHASVKVPEGWARSEAAGVVTFTDKLNAISIMEKPSPAALTEAAATSTVVKQLAGEVPAFQGGQVTTVTRKAGQAVLVTYLGDSAPDPVTNKVIRDAFERYSFWRGGTEVVLTLSGPKGADNVDPWKIVTDSVTWR